MELIKSPRKLTTLKKERSIFSDWFNNQISANTKKTYGSVLKSFEQFLRSSGIVLESLRQVKPSMIMAYRDHLITKNLANKSLNLHLSTLSSVFQEYVFKQVIVENPVSRVKRVPADTKKIKSFLTDDEIVKIAGAFSEKEFCLRVLFILLASSGQRAGSILNLKKKDIHYLDGKMILSLYIKRSKQRLLPVPSNCEEMIKQLIQNKNDDDFIFVGRGQTNKSISLRSFNNTLKAKARKAKISKEVSSHTLRRSLLSKLIFSGHSLDMIKSCVSFHSDLNTLLIYRENQEYNLKENPILKNEIKF